jgi:hypothetical protein
MISGYTEENWKHFCSETAWQLQYAWVTTAWQQLIM